jgi:choline-sulfatase
MGLVQAADGTDTGEREVFSEMHTEGVFSTCFMVRKKKYKYVYVHGEDSQLFDLEADPGEWNNLAGVPELEDVEAELKARILEEFNPDQIEGDVRASLLRRRLIKKAMRFTGTHWDYAPEFDATKQYIRGDYGPQVND